MKNKIKQIINNIFAPFKLIRKIPNGIPMLLLSFLLLTGNIVSVVSSGKYLPNNKSNSVSEIANDFRSEYKEDSFGIVYPKNLIEPAHAMTYQMCESSSEIRDLYFEDVFFNFYQANWRNRFSPLVINDGAGKSKDISLLLWPKTSYVYQEFTYSMPLLYPTSSLPLNPQSSPSDIFINKEYADYLLTLNGLPEGSYQSIYNKSIEIPYSWKHSETGERKLIAVNYIVKGIIDSQSKEYLYYKNIFGDFFLANEYFTLPIEAISFFQIKEDHITNRKKIATILDVFEYEANKNYLSAFATTFRFQYRIGFCSTLNSDCTIHQIFENPNIYNVNATEVFALYANNGYVFSLISTISLSIAFLLAFLHIFSSLLESVFSGTQLINKNKFKVFIWLSVFLLFTIFIGLLAVKIIHLFPIADPILTYKNTISLFIILIESILFAIFSVKKIKKINKNN